LKPELQGIKALAQRPKETAMKQKEKTTVARRDILRALATGAGVAVASAGPLATTAIADTESSDEKRKPRYKETEHVKAYYRVNRYPS
jgi:hypothetical protein